MGWVHKAHCLVCSSSTNLTNEWISLFDIWHCLMHSMVRCMRTHDSQVLTHCSGLFPYCLSCCMALFDACAHGSHMLTHRSGLCPYNVPLPGGLYGQVYKWPEAHDSSILQTTNTHSESSASHYQLFSPHLLFIHQQQHQSRQTFLSI